MSRPKIKERGDEGVPYGAMGSMAKALTLAIKLNKKLVGARVTRRQWNGSRLRPDMRIEPGGTP